MTATNDYGTGLWVNRADNASVVAAILSFEVSPSSSVTHAQASAVLYFYLRLEQVIFGGGAVCGTACRVFVLQSIANCFSLRLSLACYAVDDVF